MPAPRGATTAGIRPPAPAPRRVVPGGRFAPLVSCLALLASPLLAQAPPATHRARLAPVPIELPMQQVIAGVGSATATLTGATLAVEGVYRGLVTPATTVRVYESARMGMRGRLVGEFPSTGGTIGTFKGALTLSREQAAAFGRGLLYVQVQSVRAPDGNLWGWLVAPKEPRQ